MSELCECCDSREADHVLSQTDVDVNASLTGLVGARISTVCFFITGHATGPMGSRIRSRRAGIALNPPETDKQWLERTVIEITGVRAHITHKEGVYGVSADGYNSCAVWNAVANRDAATVRKVLCEMSDWPDASGAPVPARKTHGSRPNPLPETLPAGTRNLPFENAPHAVATIEMRLVGDRYLGRMQTVGAHSDINWNLSASWVDWASVEIQEEKPASIVGSSEFPESITIVGSPWIARVAIGPATLTPAPGFTMIDTKEKARAYYGDGRMDKYFDAPPPRTMFQIEPIEPAKCLECSSPATHGEWCSYCASRLGWHNDHGLSEESVEEEMRLRPEDRQAMLRNEAALKAERPRVTKQRREEAKAHPNTWPSQDGEP